MPNFDGTTISENQAAVYKFPSSLPPDALAFAGTWTVGAEKISAGSGARLELAFSASHVYLVLGGTGTVKTTVGWHSQTIAVSGIPRLYTLVSSPEHRVRHDRDQLLARRRRLRLHLRLTGATAGPV